MKKEMLTGFLRLCRRAALSAAVLLLAACSDIANDSTTAGLDAVADDAVTLSDNSGKSDKDTRKDGTSGGSGDNGGGNSGGSTSGGTVLDFGDNFIRGFDASAVDYWENDYAPAKSWADESWYDADGTKKDFFAILAAHGFDTVRLRLWVDPSVTSTVSGDSTWPASTEVENAWRSGDCTSERMLRLAKRAKDAGLKVMLDMHLSDYWTDPGAQLIPKAWQETTTATAMTETLSTYIKGVLADWKDGGVVPDFVQVGNEIDRGLLVDSAITDASTSPKTTTDANDSVAGGYKTANFKTYLAAGCKAVRDSDSSIKIIVHVTNANVDRLTYVKASGADYDIIGLSYYPWQKHGTIVTLKSNIERLKSTYEKDVMVVETSFPYQHDGTSSDLVRAKEQLIDPDTGAVYEDLVLDDTSTYVVAAADNGNQKRVIRHVMQEVYAAGGIGCCIWGGERREDYDYALFSWAGKALDAIDAFNYKPADGYTSENGGGTSSDDSGTTETYDTMTLTLNFDGFTIEGGSVTVNYGADSGTYVDVNATVASDGASATATLSNEYANASGWFNGITLTVKGSDGNSITPKLSQNYLEFSKDGSVAITVTDASTEAEKTMTLTIALPENSTASKVSVKYWSSDISTEPTDSANYDTKEATVSDNSVSVTLSNKYASSWGFNGLITVHNESNEDITSNFTLSDSSSYGTCEKCWFAFAENTTQKLTLTVVDTGGGY